MYADEIKSFRCPSCEEYISNKHKNCRFCSAPLNEEIIAKAIEGQDNENRSYRSKMSKKVMYVGFGISALGFILCFASYYTLFVSGEGFYFPWSPVVLLFGLGQVLVGAYGMWEEKK